MQNQEEQLNLEACYLCTKALPTGQSFFEGQGHKVCLSCFRTHPRCKKCGFPSSQIKHHPSHGLICEFCQKEAGEVKSQPCDFCGRAIEEGMSHYEDHGQTICQPCFKDAKKRCFTCRFPKISETAAGIEGICEYCRDSVVSPDTDIQALIKPLLPFLEALSSKPSLETPTLFQDWRLVMGMQTGKPPHAPVRFFDEYIQFASPVYYMKDKFYALPRVPRDWFLSAMAGQLVASELCKTSGLPHLGGLSPYHKLARGWVQFISYFTASKLQYGKVAKKLSRFPEGELSGDFPRLLSMLESRPPQEILNYVNQNLLSYQNRYLNR